MNYNIFIHPTNHITIKDASSKLLFHDFVFAIPHIPTVPPAQSWWLSKSTESFFWFLVLQSFETVRLFTWVLSFFESIQTYSNWVFVYVLSLIYLNICILVHNTALLLLPMYKALITSIYVHLQHSINSECGYRLNVSSNIDGKAVRYSQFGNVTLKFQSTFQIMAD